VKKPDTTTRCKIDGLSISPDHVSFDRTDDALPLPVQKDWRPILPYLGQLTDLNYYGLKVSSLRDGKYTLSIDGTEVGTYTAADLDAGVNLGNLESGPLFDQGQKVVQAINDKNDKVVHPRFREVIMFQPPGWLGVPPEQLQERKTAERNKRKEQIDSLQAEIYKLAQPKGRRFELKRAK
jgi:hypothetical protein